MYSNGLVHLPRWPEWGICVFASYDYPGSSGERYRTIIVLLTDVCHQPIFGKFVSDSRL